MTNRLFYGDNLAVLSDRAQFPDASVDLVYLDPPFNSNANYSHLFRSPDGSVAQSQIQAFEDTWEWGDSANDAYRRVITGQNSDLSTLIGAMRLVLGENPLMAYLAMMSARLVELHRVLKPTGSLYLHCDPTASHYLKLLLDAVFGANNFLNEIIWKRTSAHSSAKRYGPVHDTILFYARSPDFRWNKVFTAYDPAYLDLFFDQKDQDGRRWKRMDLTGAGTRNGETGQVWRGLDVTAKGRHWAYQPSKLELLDAAGRIHWPAKLGGMPRLKQYPEDLPGVPLQDVIDDIPPMHNLAAERLGYPTQKPLALLERIIAASSNPGDVVLDPFCGCGTAVDAAQKLGRRWIGIDITHLAIGLIEKRLRDRYGSGVAFEVVGKPADLASALRLAAEKPFDFQYWITFEIDGQAYQGGKKGMDRGIDGFVWFTGADRKAEKAIVSVKAGKNIGPAMVRDLKGVMEREKSPMGILVTAYEPTAEMKREAAASGEYEAEDGRYYPRVQIFTLGMLFDGKKPRVPLLDAAAAYRRAPRASAGAQQSLDLSVQTSALRQ